VIPLAGFLIGALSGAAQFKLLSRFTYGITHGGYSSKTALLGAVHFLLPPGVLLVMALLARRWLLPAGAGMACTLVLCAMVSFAVAQTKKRGEKTHD
jgi:hypothetical protein